MLIAWIKSRRKLLDYFSHISQRSIKVSFHQIIINFLEHQRESVGSLSAVTLILDSSKVVFFESWAFFLDLCLIDGFEHCRVWIVGSLHTMMAF